MRERFAEAALTNNSVLRFMNINRIMAEIKKSVVKCSINQDVAQHSNPRRTKFHHNKKSNL